MGGGGVGEGRELARETINMMIERRLTGKGDNQLMTEMTGKGDNQYDGYAQHSLPVYDYFTGHNIETRGLGRQCPPAVRGRTCHHVHTDNMTLSVALSPPYTHVSHSDKPPCQRGLLRGSTFQQQVSVSQGRICSDNCTCCCNEIEVEDYGILTPGRPVPTLTL